MKITYGVTVSNEHEEFYKLISHLLENIDEEDEIIILLDKSNTNFLVEKHIEYFASHPNVSQVIKSELNKDFATFKNKLIENASGDYLMQIDADEIPNIYLLSNIKSILELNPEVDVYYLPRVNIVDGITEEDIKNWGWNVDEKNRINYPDFQMRLLKLGKNITWKNKVHEILQNFETISHLPFESEHFCLFHVKNIERQRKQNQFYSQI